MSKVTIQWNLNGGLRIFVLTKFKTVRWDILWMSYKSLIRAWAEVTDPKKYVTISIICFHRIPIETPFFFSNLKIMSWFLNEIAGSFLWAKLLFTNWWHCSSRLFQLIIEIPLKRSKKICLFKHLNPKNSISNCNESWSCAQMRLDGRIFNRNETSISQKSVDKQLNSRHTHIRDTHTYTHTTH